VGEVGFHEQLTNLITINMRGEKATIVGIDFTFSIDPISLAIEIPNHGVYWFKGMKLNLEENKSHQWKN